MLLFLTYRKKARNSSIEMNISKIAKILEDRKQAADEALKIQAVFTKLDKVCSENGFEDYADFIGRVAEMDDEGGETGAGVRRRGRPAGSGKGVRRKRVTAEQKSAMKKLFEKDTPPPEVSKKLGIPLPTVYSWKKKL